MLSLVKDCPSTPAAYPSDLLLHRKHIEQLDMMRAKHNGTEIPREDEQEDAKPGSVRCNHSNDVSVYLGSNHLTSPSVERDLHDLSHIRSPIDRGIHENLLSEMHGSWSRHWPNLMMDDPLMPEKSKLLRKILQDKERRDKLSNNNTIDVTTGCDMHEAYNRILAHGTTYLDNRSCHDSESGLRDMSGDDTDSNSDKTINGEDNHDFKDDELGNDTDRVSEKSADQKEAKKARVENIITSIQPPYSQGDEDGAEMMRPKRKRYHPQQHDAKKLEHSDAKFRCIEKSALRDQLQQLQSQLQVVQRRYMELYDEDNKVADPNKSDRNDGRLPLKKSQSKASSRYETENDMLDKSDLDPSHFIKKANKLVLEQEMVAQNSSLPLQSTELENFASSLKTEINDAVESVINMVVSRILRSHSVKVPTVETLTQSEAADKTVSMPSPKHLAVEPTLPAPEVEKTPIAKQEKISAFEPIHKNHFDMHRMHAHHHPSFPHLPYYLPTQVLPPTMYTPEPEQTEALPLIVSTPKKKRTKVTDTRLSPRAARALLQESSGIMHQNEADRPMIYSPLIPPMLPTPVAIPNPSLHHLDMLNYYREQKYAEERCSSPKSPLNGCSEQLSPTDSYSMSLSSMSSRFQSKMMGGETTTLTPMHLRKAKLMFFFVRYPSSAILKIYFPDIKFNKNNTAQLVKWFSNFREFFYIQMEKYARQAIAKGCNHPEELVVNTDSELYRVLNLHYNRNNQLEVPENFRLVNQSTLREFFKSLKAGKDGEQSWKKAIYKVIARMDHLLPEFFKESNWMELMGD